MWFLRAADPVPHWRALNQEARTALQAKDYAAAREKLLQLKPLMPGNPRIAYALAAAEARIGNRTAALAGLRNLGAMGLSFDLPAEESFAALRDTAEFKAAVQQIEESKKPATRASLAFTLAERDLIPEDIAYDPQTRRFFVSSVRKGKILTVDGTQFAKTDWSVFALRVDASRRLLWATTAWIEHCESCLASDEGKSALLAFDLNSGTLKRRVESPVKGVLGDLTVSKKGDVYVSEGLHGALFRLAADATAMERLDTPGELGSPQTPALSADEKTLFVPDYLRGLAAMDVASHAIRWMEPADNIAVNGIDGLYLYGDSIIAVQNGTAPPRLIRFSKDLRQQEVLEANWTGLGDPTHGVIVGNQLYFIANSGWGDYDDKGKKKPGSAPVESTIRNLTLGR